MDPNLALQSFLAAVAEGDDECADEYHEILESWLQRGGFAPSWDHQEKRLFYNYRRLRAS